MFSWRKVSTDPLKLAAEIERLKDRVKKLEKETEGFRIGERDWASLLAGYEDVRTKVSIQQATELILRHLKLNFTETKAVPSTVILEKTK